MSKFTIKITVRFYSSCEIWTQSSRSFFFFLILSIICFTEPLSLIKACSDFKWWQITDIQNCFYCFRRFCGFLFAPEEQYLCRKQFRQYFGALRRCAIFLTTKLLIGQIATYRYLVHFTFYLGSFFGIEELRVLALLHCDPTYLKFLFIIWIDESRSSIWTELFL